LGVALKILASKGFLCCFWKVRGRRDCEKFELANKREWNTLLFEGAAGA
jgi:hypothetical protein